MDILSAINTVIPFVGKKNNNDVSTVFNSNKAAISAEHAYQKSRFGCLKTDKQLLEEFFVKVRELIDEKNMAGKYCGMLEVIPDIIHFIPQIVDKLTNELGYKVVVLNDDVEIVDNKTKEHTQMKTGTTFLVLIWSKEAVQDVSMHRAATSEYVDTEKLNVTEE